MISTKKRRYLTDVNYLPLLSSIKKKRNEKKKEEKRKNIKLEIVKYLTRLTNKNDKFFR
jgi:hypothetical protein